MGPWAWVCNRTKMKSLRFSSAGFVDLCAQPAKCVYIHTQLLFSQKLPLCCRNRTMEAFWRHWVNGYPVICSFCHFSANPLSRLDSWTSCPEIDITSTFSQLNESTLAPADEEGLRCAPGLTCLKLPFPWRIFLLIPFWRKSVIMQSDFHSNLFYIHSYYCRMVAGKYGILLLCHSWFNCKFILGYITSTLRTVLYKINHTVFRTVLKLSSLPLSQ